MMQDIISYDREGGMSGCCKKELESYRLLPQQTWQVMMNEIRHKLSTPAVVIFIAELYKVSTK
jgi:hypothetical protein